MRAAIYARVSSQQQATEDRRSLDFQVEDCTRFCQEQGYEVLTVKTEVGGGDSLDERPVLTSLRNALYRKEFAALVVWKFDRLSRDQTQQGVVIYEGQKYGVKVLSATEQYEDSPLGVFMRSAAAFASAIELTKIRARVNRGKQARIAAGLVLPHARALYGYRWADESHGTYTPDPITGPVVEQVFSWVAEGMTLRKVIAQLFDMGIPAPAGGEYWQRRTLSSLLNNPAYYGQPQALRKKYHKVRVLENGQATIKLRATRNEEPVSLPGSTVPALVTQDIAMRAIDNLSHNTFSALRPLSKPDLYLLRGGLVLCGRCKHRMSAQQHVKLGPLYRCAWNQYPEHRGECVYHHVRQPQLDATAWAQAYQVLLQPQELIRAVEDYARNVSDPTAITREALQEEQERITKQRKRMAQAFMGEEEDEDNSTLVGLYKSLGVRLKAIRRELEQLESHQETWESMKEQLTSFQAWCQEQACKSFETWQEKREVVIRLGLQVVIVPKGQVSVQFQPFKGMETWVPFRGAVLLEHAADHNGDTGDEHHRS